MTERCAYTIVNHNYLHFALTLARSFEQHHPEHHFFIFLVERDVPQGTTERADLGPRTTLVPLGQIGLPDLLQRAFYYDVTELCTSVKPDCALYLFDQGWAQVVYLDPDIFLYGALSDVYEGLDRHDIILTPHTVVPMADQHMPNELDLLKTGAYNLGFVAIAGRSEGRRFLTWWAHRLRFDAQIAFDSGLFTDQKWVDLVPSYFDHVWICKLRTLNVAYWNLHERSVTVDGGRYLVAGRPLVFFHFSGINVHDPSRLSKYQTRHVLAAEPVVAELVTAYCRAVQARMPRPVAYSFGHYAGGRQITAGERRLYRELVLRGHAVADPFERPPFSGHPGPSGAAPLDGSALINRDPAGRLDGLIRRLRPLAAVLPPSLLRTCVIRATGAVRALHFLTNPRRWFYVAAGLLHRGSRPDE